VLFDTTNNLDYKAKMTTMFEWMPTCSMVLDTNANILDVNQQALLFFKSETKELFFEKLKIQTVFLDLLIVEEIIQQITMQKKLVNKKLLLRRNDKSIACIDTNAVFFPENKNCVLLQFIDNSHQNQKYFTELVLVFRNETLRLKPYLNKPGKELLVEIINDEKIEGVVNNEPFCNNQFEIFHKDRIKHITGLFPDLSNSELALCSFLSIKMSINEIASITGKTSNSLRVAYHRILRKANFANGKDFLKIIEDLK
jgi:hypothetical protein